MKKSRMNDGKKNTRYAIESMMPLVLTDHRSKKKSVRMCAPLCSAYAQPSMKSVPYSMNVTSNDQIVGALKK